MARLIADTATLQGVRREERHLGAPSPRWTLAAPHWLVSIPLFASAFVALPRLVTFGPVSGLGAFTILEILLLCTGLVACASLPKRLLLRLFPYGCFLLWTGASVFWARPSFMGLQNAAVYLFFGLTLLLSGTLTARNPALMEHLIARGVRWIDWVALLLVLRDVLANGLPNDPDEGWLVGPRPLAVLGLVMLSWHLSRWYYGSRRSRLPIALWLLAILFSMSRTGIGVALLLVGVVVLLQTRFRKSRAAFSLPVLILATSLTVGLVVYSKDFNDRFFGGYVSQKVQVAGLQINTSGRINMWSATIESGRESPILGQGLGSSQILIEGLFPNLGHPHNDYLRVWHDLGSVGLALLLTGMVTWLWILIRAWYLAERRKQAFAHMELVGLLLLLALLLVMVPDNALIYAFIMGPTGVLLGGALGTAGHVRKRARGDVEHHLRSAAGAARRIGDGNDAGPFAHDRPGPIADRRSEAAP